MKNVLLHRLAKLELNAIDDAPTPPILVLFSDKAQPKNIPANTPVLRFQVNKVVGDVKITRGENNTIA